MCQEWEFISLTLIRDFEIINLNWLFDREILGTFWPVLVHEFADHDDQFHFFLPDELSKVFYGVGKRTLAGYESSFVVFIPSDPTSINIFFLILVPLFFFQLNLAKLSGDNIRIPVQFPTFGRSFFVLQGKCYPIQQLKLAFQISLTNLLRKRIQRNPVFNPSILVLFQNFPRDILHRFRKWAFN